MSNPSANPALYGPARPKNKPIPISHSSIHSLSTELALAKANLHKNDGGKAGAAVRRSRGEKTAALFRSNKGVSERAARDLAGMEGGGVGGGSGGGVAAGMGLTAEEYARSKRKMEEKTRLYEALQRGGDENVLLPGSRKRRRRNGYADDDEDGGGEDDERLVDFTRKWADEKEKERERRGGGGGSGSDTDSSFEDTDIEDLEAQAANNTAWGTTAAQEEMVEYTDEFGRTRTAPKSIAEKITAKLSDSAEAGGGRREAEQEEDNLIYGNVIQTHAFTTHNYTSLPSQIVPPDPAQTPDDAEEAHYLASNEIRTKGVGFYAFSGDTAERKREMGELEEIRRKTEEERVKRAEARSRRKELIEERKETIRRLRRKMVGERWLEGFMGELERGDGGGKGKEQVV